MKKGKKGSLEDEDHLQIDRIEVLCKNVEKSFTELKDRVPSMREEIVRLKMEGKECKDLEDFVYDVVNGISHGMLCLEAEPLLKEYKSRKTVVLSISRKNESNESYQRLYSEYLKILNKYKRFLNFPIPKQVPILSKLVCKECLGTSFDFVLDRSYICRDCGELVKDIISTKSSFRDTERTASVSKYKYFEESHFKDRMKEVQAQQKVNIKPELYEDFEKWLIAHKLVNNSSDRLERYSRVFFNHTLRFMKESQVYKNYEDAVLIWTTHTGKKPPDFSHLEGDILSDYEQIQKVYHTLDIKGRKSVPNAYIILYQILIRRGFKIERDFFSLSKGEEVVDWYNDILEEIFDRLEWTYRPL